MVNNIPKPWIIVALLASPLLIFVRLLGFGFSFSSIFITSTLLILSTILIFFLSKPKLVVIENITQKEHGSFENETIPEKKEAREQEEEEEEEESEILDPYPSTTEDSEEVVDSSRSPVVFSDDGSISDEESLIEIALPSGHYVGHNKEVEADEKEDEQADVFKKIPDLCLFRQRSLMELLAAEINEMNEEENLIEIDISMGSIKCSRFEIKA
ncbi:hypothetical protein UlMin_044491 [Ulmus minor]